MISTLTFVCLKLNDVVIVWISQEIFQMKHEAQSTPDRIALVNQEISKTKDVCIIFSLSRSSTMVVL
jgi:hypothetical protein